MEGVTWQGRLDWACFLELFKELGQGDWVFMTCVNLLRGA